MILETPAFVPGAPGGPELLVLLFLFLLFFAVPIAAIVILVLVVSGRRGGREDDGQRAGDAEIRRRLVDLEREVERLRERVEQENE